MALRFFAYALFTSLIACGFSDDAAEFTSSGDAIIMTGAVDERALDAFQAALNDNPGAKVLVLQYVPGSNDDKANLRLATMVRASGLQTLVPSDGLVASGGTDLLTAGTIRTAQPGACIGVHSWAYDNLFGSDTAGTSLPRDHEEHQVYLEFYRSIGIPEEFYWFTMEAAPPEGMHWMRATELNLYDVTTATLATSWDSVAPPPVCDAR